MSIQIEISQIYDLLNKVRREGVPAAIEAYGDCLI